MKILILSTWFPYPLAQGSKIRVYSMIRALAEKHEVILVSFEDVPLQHGWVEHMRGICRRVEVVPRNPFEHTQVGKIKGWLSLEPSAAAASYSEEMEARVVSVAAEEKPDLVLAYTFVTAPYALKLSGIPRVIDLDNFLSGFFWEEYQKAKAAPQKARRWLTWWKFQRYEKKLIQAADVCLVVSERDRAAVQAAFSIPASHFQVITNGVDTVKNVPGMRPPAPNQLVFNGSVTYHANLDALLYFLSSIFPSITAELPETKLLVTGRTDGVDLSAIPNQENVTFTGYLDDVRPAVAGSWACVVPLRIGAGTRLKILEAMALGTPVVTTSKGAEGLRINQGSDMLVADNPEAFARCTIQLLQDANLRKTLAENAAAKVRENYDWQSIGKRLVEIIEQAVENRGTVS